MQALISLKHRVHVHGTDLADALFELKSCRRIALPETRAPAPVAFPGACPAGEENFVGCEAVATETLGRLRCDEEAEEPPA